MWGRLEREIRLLPQVLSCTVSDDEVVVLVAPAADPEEVEAAVVVTLEQLQAGHGVRVLGGTKRPVLPGTRSRARSPLVLVGSVAATAVLAASALVAGLVKRDDVPSKPPPAVAGNDPPRIPLVPDQADPRVEAELEPEAAEEVTTVAAGGSRRVAPRPRLVRRPGLSPAPSRPGPGTPPRPGPSPRPDPSPTPRACNEPAAREAPRDLRGRHRGNGPPAWSHSVLVDPHCDRGRPRG